MIKDKNFIMHTNPIRHWEFPEFLTFETVHDLKNEINLLFENKKDAFKRFIRNGSSMYEWECHDQATTPHAFKLISHFHSSEFIHWLENLTDIRGLIPDVHLHGAGYMRCESGSSLKIHTDFNWNDNIKLDRRITILIYLNKNWQEQWNGDLQLWDKKNTHCVKRYFPKFGNCLIMEYDELGFHGHPNPLSCPSNEFRDGIRFFFYTSRSNNDERHRSLYWYENGCPVDHKD